MLCPKDALHPKAVPLHVGIGDTFGLVPGRRERQAARRVDELGVLSLSKTDRSGPKRSDVIAGYTR
ncbi:hypothetical protein MESS4_790084 [Mesorhizobium sp. STM 4661]|nr:hypothetical protein MESS4_790084 [Mesorhizobium sp. STM 4661]